MLIFVAGVVTAVLLSIWQREPAAEEITHNFPPQRIQSASVPVISNYVIFHKAEWNALGFGPVTTGVEYEASDDQTVKHQWCYVLRYYEIDQQSGRQQIWVELGSMQSDGRVEMDTFSKGKHESIDVSQTKFERASRFTSTASTRSGPSTSIASTRSAFSATGATGRLFCCRPSTACSP